MSDKFKECSSMDQEGETVEAICRPWLAALLLSIVPAASWSLVNLPVEALRLWNPLGEDLQLIPLSNVVSAIGSWLVISGLVKSGIRALCIVWTKLSRRLPIENTTIVRDCSAKEIRPWLVFYGAALFVISFTLPNG